MTFSFRKFKLNANLKSSFTIPVLKRDFWALFSEQVLVDIKQNNTDVNALMNDLKTFLGFHSYFFFSLFEKSIIQIHKFIVQPVYV